MTRENGQKQRLNRTKPREETFDEADWVDWDHWQTVEEIQDFMNGLTDAADGTSETPDPAEDTGRIARQIQRHGLQADG